MDSDDGWINPDAPTPTKRLRLNEGGTSQSVGNRAGGSRAAFDKKGPSPNLSNSDQGTGSPNKRPSPVLPEDNSRRRQDCNYGSACYRRNETHLLQYRHKLLEDAFRLMAESNDFDRLPTGFLVGDGDESVILEQARVLKDAGFEAGGVKPTVSSDAATTSSSQNVFPSSSSSNQSSNVKKDSVPGPSQSSNSWADTAASLAEERRRKYLQSKKEAKKHVQANVAPCNSASSASKKSESMLEKWEASCPFNVFLTKVRGIPNEKDGVLSANFTDLFDPSMGEVKALCHINFMVEADWILDQTMRAKLTGKPTWIIYGEENPELQEASKAFPWVKLFPVKSPFPFGHHHSKMSIVQYTDSSVRFMIYTANLVESDWDNRTQGIWISPKCFKLPSGSPISVGESPTNFRADMLQYLSSYPVKASAAWKDVIKSVDCSAIKVYFIGSAPITSQSTLNGFQFGSKKLEKVLRSFEMETQPNWPLTIQCSSIGTLGASADDWLINEFGAALAGKDRCIRGQINLVYPSSKNVKDSFDGVFGGACLPYSAMTHMKQKWLVRHMCQWKASRSGRSRAPPHIKSYFRCSPDQTKVAWFLLTSANLSKAAWGKLNKNYDRLSVMSWEAGVLFIPEIICNSKYFPVDSSDSTKDLATFPFYFDIPLTKYEKGDTPWFFETLQLEFCEKD